jgi:hypothetical protein
VLGEGKDMVQGVAVAALAVLAGCVVAGFLGLA